MTTPVRYDNISHTFDLKSLYEFTCGDDDQKLLLSEKGDVSVKNALTSRLSGTKDERINAAYTLLNTIRKEFGDAIAEEIRNDPQFKATLEGKPLSARRIRNVLMQAEEKLQNLNSLKTQLSTLQAKDKPSFVDKQTIQHINKQITQIENVLARRDNAMAIPISTFKGHLSNHVMPTLFQNALDEAMRSVLQELGLKNPDANLVKSLIDNTLSNASLDSMKTIRPSDMKALVEANKDNIALELTKPSEPKPSEPKLPTLAGTIETNLRELLNAGLPPEDAVEGLQALFENGQASAEDIQSVAQHLQLDLSVYAGRTNTPQTQGTGNRVPNPQNPPQPQSVNPEVKENTQPPLSNPKSVAQNNLQKDPKSVAQDNPQIQPNAPQSTQSTKAPPLRSDWKEPKGRFQAASKDTLEAIAKHTNLFLQQLSKLYSDEEGKPAPLSASDTLAAQRTLAKINYETNKQGGIAPSTFLDDLMQVGDDVAQNILISDFYEQQQYAVRDLLNQEVAQKITDAFANRNTYAPDSEAAQMLLARVKAFSNDSALFSNFLKTKELDPADESQKAQIIDGFTNLCYQMAQEITDAVYSPNNALTSTSQVDRTWVNINLNGVGSQDGPTLGNLQVGQFYAQNTNTCFMLSVVNSLCMRQEGVEHLKTWLQSVPNTDKLTNPNFNDFELKLGYAYNAQTTNQAQKWTPGNFGVVDTVLDVLNLPNTGGYTLNANDGDARLQGMWVAATQHLNNHEMGVIHTKTGGGHYITLVGTWGDPKAGADNYGLVVRDSMTGKEDALTIKQIQGTRPTLTFFSLPKAEEEIVN